LKRKTRWKSSYAFSKFATDRKRQIGGQTGDVLGALEQAGEVIVLLVASAAVQGLR
jgi:cobalamin synthase